MRVMIIQRHLLLAEAISWVLERAEVHVAGIATTGRNALEALAGADPDILLVDLTLPDMSGLDVGRRALKAKPGIKVLALATAEDREIARNALQAGFHGILPIDMPVSKLVASLKAVAEGQTILPQDMIAAIMPERRPHTNSCAVPSSQLTTREREILSLLATGATNKEIATHLTITPNTVRTHVQNLLLKLGVNSRLKAVLLASANGLLVEPNAGFQPRD